MKQSILLLFISFFLIVSGYAEAADRGIPEGLYDALYSTLKKDLKQDLNSFGFDTSIDLSEITPGIPVENYHLKEVKQFDSIDIDAPVMSLVESDDAWCFHLKARGRYIMTHLFHKSNGNWVWAGTWGRRPAWEEIRAAYPESTGIRPVIIHGVRGWGYVHFPHINDHNLTLMAASESRERIRNQLKNMTLSKDDAQKLHDKRSVLSESWDSTSLVHSRITLQYLKNEIRRAQEGKAEYKRRLK